MSRSILFYIGIISFLSFVLIAATYDSHWFKQFDLWFIQIIQQWESSYWTKLAKFLSFIGSGKVVGMLAIVVIVLFFMLRDRLAAAIFFITVSVSALLNMVLKLVFKRERPSIHPIIEQAGFSFPSGHSMIALTFYGIITLLLWRHIHSYVGKSVLIGLSLFMILTIGLSRVYLGVHYPSDIMGAYMASLTLLAMIFGLLRYWKDVNDG